MKENLYVKKYQDYALDLIFDEILEKLKINESMLEEDEIDLTKMPSIILDGLKDAISLGVDVTTWLWKLLDKLGNKKWVLILGIAAIIKFGYNPHEVMDDLQKKGYEISQNEQQDVIDKAEKKAGKKGKVIITNPFGPEGKDIEKFMAIMAKRESSNNPNAINSKGYIGLYQFGKLALQDVGLYPKISTETFRKNPNIFPVPDQDDAMKKLIKKNKTYLKKYHRYVGKTIKGIKMTEAGLLAGAHLVGHGGVKTFLRSKGTIVPQDGNGTPITEYMAMFQNMDLKI